MSFEQDLPDLSNLVKLYASFDCMHDLKFHTMPGEMVEMYRSN